MKKANQGLAQFHGLEPPDATWKKDVFCLLSLVMPQRATPVRRLCATFASLGGQSVELSV